LDETAIHGAVALVGEYAVPAEKIGIEVGGK
jgi:hypothetical protein